MIELTAALLGRWFREDNAKYFGGKLKSPRKIVISDSRSFFGRFVPKSWDIEMSVAFIRSEGEYHNTFLHEMCHMWVRQEYGWMVQPHGIEWQRVAERVTEMSGGAYGVIKRCGKRCELRSVPMSRYIVFTDKDGNVAVAKYAGERYVDALIALDCIMGGTDAYIMTSRDAWLDGIKLRRVYGRGVRWNVVRGKAIDVILSLGEVERKIEIPLSDWKSPLAAVS